MKEWYEAQLTMAWQQDYFSFMGRIGRKTYITRLLISIVAVVVLRMIFDGAFRVFMGTNDFLALMAKMIDLSIISLNMLCGIALFARRMHDMDKEGACLIKSSLWLIVIETFHGIFLLLFLYSNPAAATQFLITMSPVYGIIYIGLLLWGLYYLYWAICCLFKKGTDGPNQFGPDLLA